MNAVSPISADMRAIFDAQRQAFLRAGAPSLHERRADLKKLADAIGRSRERLMAAISADFGHRSRHETELGELFPAQSAIRHTLAHLARWMRPKRVAVGLELLPAGARILYQPVGVVGIISPWNYPFNLAICKGDKCGYHHAAFEVASETALDDGERALTARGIAPVQKVDLPWKRSFFLRDPDGLLSEYYVTRHGKRSGAAGALAPAYAI